MKKLQYLLLAFALSSGSAFAAKSMEGLYLINADGTDFKIRVKSCGDKICGYHENDKYDGRTLKGTKSFKGVTPNADKTAGEGGELTSVTRLVILDILSIELKDNGVLHFEMDFQGQEVLSDWKRISD